MDHMHDILQFITENNENAVLATIVKIEGSAYRKEGTSMLFTQSGKQIGVISIGCLEEDLSIRAKQLQNHPDHFSSQIIYDTSSEDDLSWGRGIGCNGKIYILLEKVTETFRNNLKDIYVNLKNGFDVIVIKNLQSVPNVIESVYEIKESHMLINNEHAIKSSRLNRIVNGKFYHLIVQKPRLIIFGAGLDVKPLVELAKMAGYSVFVWDWREELLCSKMYPDVHFIKRWETFHFQKNDSVIVMTHDFKQDKRILHLLLDKNLKYLGVLGPRKRTKRLLNDKAIPTHIYSPVGLPIGADGPYEIAISIIADLIRVKRGVSNFEQIESNRIIFSGGEK